MENNKSPRPTSRREFIKWSSSIGLSVIAPSIAAEITEAKQERKVEKDKKESKSNSQKPPESDIHHYHPLEYEGIQENFEKFKKSNNHWALYNYHLKETLKNNDLDEINIKVQTVGEKTNIKTTGGYDREIKGWKATRTEVNQLAEFGTIKNVPEFSEPAVRINDVSVKDLERIADLSFTINIMYIPPDPLVENNSQLSTSSSTTYRDIDDLRSGSFFNFNGTDYNVASHVQIGVIDTGYGDTPNESSPYVFSENHAEKIGISEGDAKNFGEGNSWDNPEEGGDHGTKMANIIAYMLDPNHNLGHSDLFIPLKVSYEDDDGNLKWSHSAIVDAIEYAEKEGIDILNLSFGTGEWTICPTEYCKQYEGYRYSKYFGIASAGNDADQGSGVRDNSASTHNITIGGFSDDCSNGYEAYSSSQYGNVSYSNPGIGYECEYCSGYEYSEFHPHAYGCYHIKTDTNNYYSCGTSGATAQATAIAAIMQSNYLYDFEKAKQIYSDMSSVNICPSSKSEQGQMLDAKYAYNQTK